MPRYEHVVSVDEQGMRLDALLATLEGVVSRSAAVKLIEQGLATLNGEATTKKRIVVAGDTLAYLVSPERPRELVAEPIFLDIRHEDEGLIVLSKQAGLVCHPSQGHESGTLVNALIAHCGYENLAQLQGEDRPGIVHRLDKDTTGLMLVAKRDDVGAALQDAIRLKAIDRRYLALVHGYIAPNTGLIDAPLARGQADRQRMVIANGAGSRSSVTTFTVLERFAAGRFDDGYTLIECKLFTGRTHQIRAHLDYIGHACVGDTLYGSQTRPKAQLGLTRQFLHSYRLEFTHPLTGQTLNFSDPLPEDLQAALAQITPSSMGHTL
ncbi:MAG: RluA family pseudouridine synthase [Coriobacteriales bacterium]|jgi:23S rRNA pseudouridine1911/1915/1917 synthase|nr:RluA family pseudouridine synthase [Coriobacteriales bacterium]